MTIKTNNWSVAIACSVIIGLVNSYSRTAGLLFIATIEQFDVSKSEASIPFFWFNVVKCLGGPLVGVVAEKYGSREVTTAGFVLSAMGIGMCFFAENVTVLIILWGVVFGLGSAMSVSMVGDILNDHFDQNYIGTAAGISFGGAGIGSFINVFLCDSLLTHYGLSGTFLILSAIILHGVPTGMVLSCINARECFGNSKQFPKVLNDCDFNIDNTGSYNLSSSKNKQILQYTTGKPIEVSMTDCGKNIDDIESSVFLLTDNEESSNSNGGISNKNSGNVVKDLKSNKVLKTKERVNNPIQIQNNSNQNNTPNNSNYNINGTESCGLSLIHDNQTLKSTIENIGERSIADYGQNIEDIECTSNEEPSCSSAISKIKSYNTVKSEDSPANIGLDTDALNQISNRLPLIGQTLLNDGVQPIGETVLSKGNLVKKEEVNHTFVDGRKINPRSSSKLQITKVLQNIIPYVKIFWNPTFLLLCIAQSSMMVLVNVLMTIIIDTLKDKELEPGLEIYPLYCFQIADTIGRFGLGWVTDCNLLSNVNFNAICYAGLGISCGAIALSSSFSEFIAAVSTFGILSGASVAVFTGTTCEFIKKDQLKMAMSSRFVLSVPMFLTAGPLIRLFRENMGSYDGIYYVLAILSFICSVLTLLIPPIARCRMKNRKTPTLN